MGGNAERSLDGFDEVPFFAKNEPPAWAMAKFSRPSGSDFSRAR